MDIIKPATLDILDLKAPALSTTSDMPVETKPDPLPVVEVKEAVPPDTEVDGEAEQLEESATSTTETPGQPAEKTPRGVGKKIAELTRKAAEAEARQKTAEDNLKAALALKERAEPAVEDDPEPLKPSKDTFTDPDAYDTALLAYADEKAAHTARKQVKQMLAENEQKVQQAQQEEGLRLTRESYNARLETARSKYADFEEVAQSPDVQISMPMAHTIMMSEQGPDIQYYLGKNPEETARIMKLSYPLQLMELGKLAVKLSDPKTPVSNASPPIKPLKTGTTVITKTPEEESMEEYAARRKKELQAQMRH